MSLIIHPITAFNDNYIWLIIKSQLSEVICIDPGDATPLLEYLKANSLTLSHILLTHHHFDHIGGVNTLKKHYPEVFIIGPDDERISIIDQTVKEGDSIHIKQMDLSFKVMETPGHTTTHICFYEKPHRLLFCGDTLFSAGCGRLFEGTPTDMLNSLEKLNQLPAETKVYCAHEYTLSNLTFAKELEPSNQAILDRIASLKPGELSLPSTLKREREINPFLRCDTPALINKAKEQDSTVHSKTDTFRIIRKLKDSF